jgi:hypothetical protein
MQIKHYNFQNDKCVPKHKNKYIFATKKRRWRNGVIIKGLGFAIAMNKTHCSRR